MKLSDFENLLGAQFRPLGALLGKCETVNLLGYTKTSTGRLTTNSSFGLTRTEIFFATHGSNVNVKFRKSPYMTLCKRYNVATQTAQL